MIFLAIKHLWGPSKSLVSKSHSIVQDILKIQESFKMVVQPSEKVVPFGTLDY